MRNVIIRLIINAIALFVATRVGIPGLSFDGDWTTIALVAFIFGLVNALIRPFLTMLDLPVDVVDIWFVHVHHQRRDACAYRLACGTIRAGVSCRRFHGGVLGRVGRQHCKLGVIAVSARR